MSLLPIFLIFTATLTNSAIKAAITVSDASWDAETHPIQSCVKLRSEFEVGWLIMPRDDSGRGPYAVFEFLLSLDADNYFAFGLSGHVDSMSMVGSDIIAMITHNGMSVSVAGYNVIATQSRCTPYGTGVCPNAIDNLEVSLTRVSGREVFVRLRRHLIGADPHDVAIRPGSFQSVIWASGHWRSGPMYHGKNRIQSPLIVDFGDASYWTCTTLTRRGVIPPVPPQSVYDSVTPSVETTSLLPRTVDALEESTEIENCVKLDDRFEIGWKVQPHNETIAFRYTVKLAPGWWFGFGQSGSDTGIRMVGSAPVVLSLDYNGNISLRHYYITAKALCQRNEGVCENDSPVSVRWAKASSGVVSAHFSWLVDDHGFSQRRNRPLQRGLIPIIWATGPLADKNDAEAHDNLLYHRRRTIRFLLIDFWQKQPTWNCSLTSPNDTMVNYGGSTWGFTAHTSTASKLQQRIMTSTNGRMPIKKFPPSTTPGAFFNTTLTAPVTLLSEKRKVILLVTKPTIDKLEKMDLKKENPLKKTELMSSSTSTMSTFLIEAAATTTVRPIESTAVMMKTTTEEMAATLPLLHKQIGTTSTISDNRRITGGTSSRRTAATSPVSRKVMTSSSSKANPIKFFRTRTMLLVTTSTSTVTPPLSTRSVGSGNGVVSYQKLTTSTVNNVTTKKPEDTTTTTTTTRSTPTSSTTTTSSPTSTTTTTSTESTTTSTTTTTTTTTLPTSTTTSTTAKPKLSTRTTRRIRPTSSSTLSSSTSTTTEPKTTTNSLATIAKMTTRAESPIINFISLIPVIGLMPARGRSTTTEATVKSTTNRKPLVVVHLVNRETADNSSSTSRRPTTKRPNTTIPPIYCNQLPVIENGVLKNASSTMGRVLVGENVQFVCKEGFEMIPDGSIGIVACEQSKSGGRNGAWQTPLPQCVKIPICLGNVFQNVTNGACRRSNESDAIINEAPKGNIGNQILENVSFRVNETVFCRCEEEYEMTATNGVVTCVSDNTWSTLPTCTKIPVCPGSIFQEIEHSICLTQNDVDLPIKTYNGTLYADISFRVGEVVYCRCENGYETLSGDATVICKSDNVWSPLPRCTRIPVCNGSALQQITNGFCQKDDNNKLTSSSNNDVFANVNFRLGNQVTCYCKGGYQLIGSHNVTCQADNLWSSLPWCRIIVRPGHTDLQEPLYYGRYIGPLSVTSLSDSRSNTSRRFTPAVGQVYAASHDTIAIVGFSFEDNSPGTYFITSKDLPQPSDGPGSVTVPDEMGRYAMLNRYDNATIVLQLPKGITTSNLKWLSVFNRKTSTDLGSVIVPTNFSYPQSSVLGVFKTSGVFGLVKAVDSRTFRIDNFYYTPGKYPSYFWVGTSDFPQRIDHPVPYPSLDKDGTAPPLENVSNITVYIHLPNTSPSLLLGKYLAVFSPQNETTLAYVNISDSAKAVIPSGDAFLAKGRTFQPETLDGCEHLDKRFEIRWKSLNSTHALFRYLFSVGTNEWVGLGLIDSSLEPDLNSTDIWVSYYDTKEELVKVIDLFAADLPFQCSDKAKAVSANTGGLCNHLQVTASSRQPQPDGSFAIEVSFVREISPNNSQQNVVWAIGPWRREDRTGDAIFFPPTKIVQSGNSSSSKLVIDFNQTTLGDGGGFGESKCVGVTSYEEPTTTTSTTTTRRPVCKPWPDLCPIRNWVFVVTLGPPGGVHGYQAITGRKPADLVYYINGQLAPELVVRRFSEYLFYMATGRDNALYITTDSTGGYEFFSRAQRKHTRVFAGLVYGQPKAVAIGNRCVYKETPKNASDPEPKTFIEYSRRLAVFCEPPGNVGAIHWTPTLKTPDCVYYMSFSHKNVGWRIRVEDENDSAW